MIHRFLTVLAVALLLQGTVFAIYYDDLLFLRRPLPEIVGGPEDAFVRHAEAALARRRLTARHLDTIAGGASAFGLIEMEVAALERRVLETPLDRPARLRLADALRRVRRFADAETIYLEVLASSGREQP